jgi:hypothetical protein
VVFVVFTAATVVFVVFTAVTCFNSKGSSSGQKLLKIHKRSVYNWFKERDHWGDPDVDERIILERIFRKWDGVRIETGGGHL